jgi:RimJ/RimL family protein N-acetyltransferase
MVAAMYDPTLQIETANLILRPPQLSDLDRWAEGMADPEAANPIGDVQPRPLVWRALATMVGAWSLTGCAMFSVLEKRSGLWVGRLGPWQPEGWPEVIHCIAPENRGSQAVAQRRGSRRLRQVRVPRA